MTERLSDEVLGEMASFYEETLTGQAVSELLTARKALRRAIDLGVLLHDEGDWCFFCQEFHCDGHEVSPDEAALLDAIGEEGP